MEKPALKNVTVRACTENTTRGSEVSVVFQSEDIEAIKTVAFRYLIHYLNASLERVYSFLKSKSLKWTNDAFELQIREEDYRDHEALMFAVQQSTFPNPLSKNGWMINCPTPSRRGLSHFLTHPLP